jgi:hypothetical protein
MTDVKSIVREYLKKNGYDGLYNEWGECGCVNEDLFPCGSDPIECKPGHKIERECRRYPSFRIGKREGK